MKLQKIILATIAAASFGANASIKEELPPQTFDALSKYYPIEDMTSIDAIHLEDSFKLDSRFYIISLNDSIVAISEDGKHLIGGDVVDMETKENYLEKAKDNSRKRVLDAIEPKNYISYPHQTEEKQGVIFVYSDITCGYCQMLHKEYEKLTASGFEIRVLPFPRNVGSEHYLETAVYKNTVAMMSTPINEERIKIHDKLMLGLVASHAGNNKAGMEAVAHGIESGVRVGLKGTPHIVFDDGRAISGYMTAEKLIETYKK